MSGSNGSVQSLPEHVRVCIVGTGFSGIAMAIRLKRDGIDDFVLLERAEDLGGTWRDNTYPGCACDVPSHLYSYSFEPNPGWSRTFSPQPEIWDYLRRTSDKHGVTSHMRFGHELKEAAWDEDEQVWRLETSQGSLTADVVVSGVGGLSEPKLPDLPGIDSFEGEAFHSAQWNHDVDIEGKRVAVIGTGASSIQIVPRIQPKVGKLALFQRTPPWIVPQRDRRMSRVERALYKLFPPAQLAMRAAIYWARELFVLGFMRSKAGGPNERLALRHLHKQVPPGELRDKLTPNYRMGCKRVLISDTYYPALQKPNVEVVTDAIAEITPKGIRTADGVEHELDVIVFGTGFHVSDMPIAERVRGRDGLRLFDVWEGSPQAYLGITVSGFPNFFMLLGPNTGLGHNSVVFMTEAQANYVMESLRYLNRSGVHHVEPRPEVQAKFIDEIQSKLQGTVWNSGGCKSWYLDAKGRNSVIWPGFTWPYRKLTSSFDPADYVLAPAAARLDGARARSAA
jgi:cation diffusion facilitator CzcD-associated flavoprotein CzcO